MSTRLVGLDRLRAGALLLMVVHHLVDWLVGSPEDVIPGWDGFLVTEVAAPAFAVAAGASAWTLRAKRCDDGVPAHRVTASLVRRYGLLVPIGITLLWVVTGNPFGWGVLETLGVAVLVAAIVAWALPDRVLAVAAVAALVLAPVVEHVASTRTGWLADNVLAGRFPIALYAAFALAGMAGAHHLRGRDRPGVAAALSLALAGVALAGGLTPDRYPGDETFVVPGLALTLGLYALLTAAPLPSPVAQLLDRAARHTFGIFLGHYVVRVALDRLGGRDAFGDAPRVGLALAIAGALTFAWLAPRVPQPPWSPRTGWRRRPASSREGSASRVSVGA
jgi:peptidoglycan/LPS O-acetylase OafA/YrhL